LLLAAFLALAMGSGAAWPAIGGGHGGGFGGGGHGGFGGGHGGGSVPRGREFGDGRAFAHERDGRRFFVFPFYEPYYGYYPYYPGYPYNAYCDPYSPYYEPQYC